MNLLMTDTMGTRKIVTFLHKIVATSYVLALTVIYLWNAGVPSLWQSDK